LAEEYFPDPDLISTRPLSLRWLTYSLSAAAFIVIFSMLGLFTTNLTELATMAEESRTKTIPEALGQHEKAVMARQLGLFAEVVAQAKDVAVRDKALKDARTLAHPFLRPNPDDAFTVRLQGILRTLGEIASDAATLQRREDELHAQQRQADHLLTSVDILASDLLGQIAREVEAAPRAKVPGLLQDYFRTIRLQSVFFDLRRRLGTLESAEVHGDVLTEQSYYSGLLVLGQSLLGALPDTPNHPALEAAFDDFRTLAYLFDLQQENFQLREGIVNRLAQLSEQLSRISEEITSNAAVLASRGADAIAIRARDFLMHALLAIGFMGFLFVLAGVALQREVVRPTQMAAAALAQLRNTDGELKLGVSDLREIDAINQAVVQLAAVLKEREAANRKLLAMAQMKTQFTSNVSHELRTPLTSVRGFIKIIKRDFNKLFLPLVHEDPRLLRRAQRIAGDLDIIARESDRLGILIDDVLDVAAFESGRMAWRDAWTDVAEIIEYTRKTMSGAFIQLSEVTLSVDVQGPLPRVYVDAHRLQQVLLNLLNNAAKFTAMGQVQLTVRHTAGRVHFAVSDTGPGIPSEEHTAIFEKFHQGGHSPEMKDKPRGTGLGLAISRQIVEHYGGQLQVLSTVGQGSVFFFSLPLRAAERVIYETETET
jgi:signal transduction histidine kinase